MAEVQTQGFPLLKFSGGLNTEASPVNIEPTDATDIVNMTLGINGGFGPRQGFDFIAEQSAGGFYYTSSQDYTATGSFNDGAPAATVFTTMTATGDLKSFTVLHVGRELRIYDFSTITGIVEISTPYQVVDMTSYSSANAIFAKTKFLNDRNRLLVVNRYMTTGYLYLKSDNTFEFVPITVFTRNLSGNPNPDSRVNLNGKSFICIKDHTASATNQPGVGAEWKIYWVLYGSKIIDLDSSDPNYVNHDWVSGTAYYSNIEAVTTNYFTTATFSAGRLWLSGYGEKPNTIYFSQTVTDDLFYGRCYQFADPLSDVDSEPVDTDGGTLVVNGAERIISLLGFSNGILVFANNGVWYVGGASLSETFKATLFSVESISGSGIIGENNACVVEDTVIYFGYGGVYVLTKDDLVGRIKPKSISDKIQTLYTGLPLYVRKAAKAVYNNSERRVYYFCNLTSNSWIKNYNPTDQSTHFRDALVFDIRLKAWYKYQLKEDTVGSALAVGDVFVTQASQANVNLVTDNAGDIVENAADDLVYSDSAISNDAEVLNLLVLTKPNGTHLDIAFGKMGNGLHQDFAMKDDEAYTIDSVFLSAQLTFQAPIGKKQPPYAYFIFERVESGVLGDNGEDITAGGAFLSVAADWASSAISGKYGDAVQIYRPNKFTVSRFGGISPAVDVVAIKERLRTRGNAIQFKITNDAAKGFYLYGVNFLISVTPRV